MKTKQIEKQMILHSRYYIFFMYDLKSDNVTVVDPTAGLPELRFFDSSWCEVASGLFLASL
jgi:hypothetical protein